jgi:hypothetical protein
MFLKLKMFIGQAAGIILVICLFWSGGLLDAYFDYPRNPVPSVGRVVPLEVKGRTVFITIEERSFLKLLGRISITAGAIMIFVLVTHGGDPFKKRPAELEIPAPKKKFWPW